MKKLSFFLMAMILCYAPALRAADVTETIAMKKFGGLSTSSYENVTKTGTSDKGTEMVAYAFNPTTGQVRGNKTAIAGASVTSADANKNWSLYNTQAMPGAIKKITVTQTATGSNKFQNNLYVALGTTNQGAVTTVTGAQKTTGTATEFTFEIDEKQGYTYFKLLSNEKFTGGSVAGVVVTVTYAEAASNPDAVKYTVTAKVNDPAMGTVSGAGEYEEGKTATLTANANAGYKFVNWSNGSTDNPLKITVTENVELTANFEAIPPMTCAEAAAAASGATVVLNPFDVVYVVKGAGYTYIKDDSGVNLIFDFTMDDQFKAGDHVEGFVGVSSPYNGLPEIKPTVSFADLKVTPGTAPEATVFETVPTKEDVNKYVVFKGVKLTSNISYNTSSATNATISVGGKNVTLRNTFKLAASLTSGSTYDIYAFVAIYNGNIQMYYASSVDVSPERTITATVNPAETGTVTGAGTYKEGKTATLKATPAEGYAFTCWTEGEDTVSTAANYSFKVAADRSLVANFAKKTYTVTVTANAEGENVVTGAGEYEEGKEVTVSASEDLEGWVFIGWTEDGEFVANDPEYTFVVKGDVELVAVYAMDLGENKVTDLVIDGDNMLLTGSVAGFPMGTMNLELALGEYDEEEGTFLLTEDSKLYVGETNFTFVDGMAAVDMSTNSAMAIVVFEHNGTYYYMTVNMSKKIEATVIEIDNATVTIEERSMGFGDEVYHVLKMESTWSDGETTYPVSLETTEFDQTKESQEVAASITVGGMGDEDPWLGNAEGDVTITVANGVVTVEGLLENAYAWPAPIAFDLTISGTLPVEKIAYELNGGAFPEVKVPTNAELWEAFKPYYNTFYGLSRADQTIDKVSTFAPTYMQKIMTDEASEYKWLGDYVLSVATAAGVTLSTDMAAANEGGWRWAVHAFFNAAAGQHGAAGIDFTEAGKPEVWGAAYEAEYGVVLPTEPVDAPYTLPTPVKEGYKFVGWYDNAEGTGEAYTVIPAGWSGTLYAIWEAEGPATALDNIAIEGKVVKTIINGQLIIVKDGVQYNAQGQVIK